MTISTSAAPEASARTARTHDDMIRVAHELAESIRPIARQAELDRKPDDGVIQQARDSGLFDLMSPRQYGGAELDLDTFFEVSLILGEADTSHGWVLSFYIEHVWMFCQFPEEFQRELFADRSYVLAPGALAATGRAAQSSDGYHLSGRWPWGTGIMHADWVLAGAVRELPNGQTDVGFFALPVEDTTYEDTWNVDGMCATGSNDILVTDKIVPANRVVSIPEMLNADAPGSLIHAGPLYRTPMAPILSFTAALPVLGQAKAALKEFNAQLAGRKDRSGIAQSERVDRQELVGRVALDLAAAESLLRDVLRDVMHQRGSANEATRVRWTTSIGHAVHVARRGIDALCDTAGAGAHRLDNPLQRARRDANTAACHMVFDMSARYQAFGRTILDQPAASTWH